MAYPLSPFLDKKLLMSYCLCFLSILFLFALGKFIQNKGKKENIMMISNQIAGF